MIMYEVVYDKVESNGCDVKLGLSGLENDYVVALLLCVLMRAWEKKVWISISMEATLIY